MEYVIIILKHAVSPIVVTGIAQKTQHAGLINLNISPETRITFEYLGFLYSSHLPGVLSLLASPNSVLRPQTPESTNLGDLKLSFGTFLNQYNLVSSKMCSHSHSKVPHGPFKDDGCVISFEIYRNCFCLWR